MTKAYDLKDLAAKLKDAGMPIAAEAAEEAATQAYKAVKLWLKESAELSESKVDDVIIAFIDQLDKVVLPAIDKIDGKQG